ncbi:hypothetical protein AB9P05_19400 [Roseivirga sp. BDSF3-8]|uniref:hypothetical protein n=1 Tax=Roseivirga sp. BDSF3-8 TaxID=3241598 RepID=UPI003531D6B9
MKKKSLSLDALKVDSFVTNTRAIKGGIEDKPTAPPSNSCYFSCFLACPQEEELA